MHELFILSTLLVAGFAKGLVGLGLPPITMGLLVVLLPPLEAASIMVIPALVTNLWQAMTGKHLRNILLRLWPMLLLNGAVTLVFAGSFTVFAELAIALLGCVLIAYGLYSFTTSGVIMPSRQECWFGPITGLLTGIINAWTGVSSMPVVPFLHSVRLESRAFVQAMGVSFFVSSLALCIALGVNGRLNSASGFTIMLATLSAVVGMKMGIVLRSRLDAKVFRTVFLTTIIALGLYLVLRLVLTADTGSI